MIKSKIPIPAKVVSLIPVPIKNQKVDERKIKPPSKQVLVTQPSCQGKTKPSSLKPNSNPTRRKTNVTSVVPKKPISSNNHVRQTKVQPLIQKPLKKPATSAFANIDKRKTVVKDVIAQKAKPQKSTGITVANQNLKRFQKTKQLESHVKLKDESKMPVNIPCSKRVPKIKITEPPSKSQEKMVDVVVKKPKEMESNFGVSDSEFLNSDYYKSLILSKKETSPGILKICPETKCSSNEAKFQTPVQKLLSQYKSADEFVEDVRRNSARFHKRNGKMAFSSTRGNQTPEQVILNKFNSVDDFVEDVRRNSARFLNRFGKSCYTPVMQCRRNKNSPFHAKKFDILSMKENLDCQLMNVQKLTENKKTTISKTSSQLNFDPAQRRWTCNVTNKLTISGMNTSQIADEIRRYSLMGKDSLCQQPIKTSALMNKNHYETLNPHQNVLREIEILRSKKKGTAKKKVTFLIPSKNSPELPILNDEIHHKKNQSKLSDIAESESQTSTPELDLNFCRSKSQSEENKRSPKDSADTTPELNLPTYRCDVSSKESKTFKLDCQLQNEPILIASTSDKVDEKLDSCERTPITLKSNSINDIQTLERLSISSCNENFQLSVEDKSKIFCVNDKKIFTPHTVAKYPNPDFSRDESPSFLPGKSVALDSLAPISTPFVLRSMCSSSDVDISSVRQKLNFGEKIKLSDERRESLIIIQNIPTIQKMCDSLCDKECCILTSLSSSSTEVLFRDKITNPIAAILSEGDEMHFIPVCSP